jgi:hypothetical protein
MSVAGPALEKARAIPSTSERERAFIAALERICGNGCRSLYGAARAAELA